MDILSKDFLEPRSHNVMMDDNILDDKSEKAFIMDFCISETQNTICCVTSDRNFYFWEYKGTSYRQFKHFRNDVIQTGVWYLKDHDCYIAAGGDFNLRVWKISTNMLEEEKKCQKIFYAHEKLIT